MFENLDEKELHIVIDAMEVCKYKKGDVVIEQGAKGEVLYVIESGELDCFRIMKDGEQPTFLKKYQPGEAFGELALLYNAPRAATIISCSDATLYSLDRHTFNFIVKGSAQKKKDSYEAIFKKVGVFSSMDNYERTKLADAVKERRFKTNEYIIRQGDSGDEFFIVTDGQAKCVMKIDGKDIEVMKYKVGDYFGEVSLLKKEPRAASVIAIT